VKTVFALLCTVLTACSASVSTNKAGAAASASGPLSFTSSDLTNAIAIATAAGPAGAPIVQCFSYLNSQLALLQSQTSQTNASMVGIATTFTIADLALANVNNALSPGAQTAYNMACGPLVLSVQNQGLTFQAQIAALAALVAK
jgi:hypothetical protein